MDSDIATYRTLLESTKVAPWMLDWKSRTFTYIGPQIVTLLGWPKSSWNTLNDWTNRIHEKDRDATTSFCAQQSNLGLDHEATYRAITPSGTFIWVRNIVHVIKKNDAVESLAGFIFGITNKTEDKNSRVVIYEVRPKYTSSVFPARKSYCFTSAEAKLAVALLSGKKAGDYANEKGISINTVRSQIRSLLEKVGVNRQADLIRTLFEAEIVTSKKPASQ